MYEIIVVQAGFHGGNCKFMDANRTQVIVNRILMFYLALLLLNSGGKKNVWHFPILFVKLSSNLLQGQPVKQHAKTMHKLLLGSCMGTLSEIFMSSVVLD